MALQFIVCTYKLLYNGYIHINGVQRTTHTPPGICAMRSHIAICCALCARRRQRKITQMKETKFDPQTEMHSFVSRVPEGWGGHAGRIYALPRVRVGRGDDEEAF